MAEGYELGSVQGDRFSPRVTQKVSGCPMRVMTSRAPGGRYLAGSERNPMGVLGVLACFLVVVWRTGGRPNMCGQRVCGYPARHRTIRRAVPLQHGAAQNQKVAARGSHSQPMWPERSQRIRTFISSWNPNGVEQCERLHAEHRHERFRERGREEHVSAIARGIDRCRNVTSSGRIEVRA
jgi:hypothetical protein